MIITAEDARKRAFRSLRRDNSRQIEIFFGWVESQINIGLLKGEFYTCGEHFSEEELQYLNELGYKLYWNRACLWYEVSW